MVGSVQWIPRGCLLPVACTVVLTAVAIVGGCARVVTGAARAGDHRPARPIPVADLLIEPTRFPAEYEAAVLPPKDLDRVLSEIDGVPAGSEVTPAKCAPLPLLADQRAAVQGSDDASGTRLVVSVIRPIASVRARVTQLAECPSFTVKPDAGEVAEESKVSVALPPAPPVDADDSYAVDETVVSESSEEADTRTLTLVALVGDVQVMASWQRPGSSDAEPDSQALDTLFTDAVLKVRQQVPR